MSITAKKSTNELEIRMMVGKAMCAYANWQSTEDDKDQLANLYGETTVRESIAAHQSEYEATVRCIAMFANEHLPEICKTVIEMAEEEFGI